MKLLWEKISNLGLSEEDGVSEQMRKRLLNRMLLLAFTFTLITVIWKAIYPDLLILLIGLSILLMTGLGLFLNAKVGHKFSRHFVIFIMLITISSTSYYYGLGFNNYLFLLNSITLVFFLIKDYRIRIAYFSIITSVIFLSTYWSQTRITAIDSNYVFLLSMLNAPLSLLIQLVLLNFYAKEQSRNNYLLKKNQKELEKKEAKFRTVFESNQLGIAVSGESSGFIDYNDAFCNMLLYTKEELEQCSSEDITSVDFIESSESLTGMLKKKEIESFSLEKDYIRKDGEIVHALTNVTGIYDEDGNFLHSVATIVNITEAQLAQKALKESERKFKAFFHKLPFPVLLLNFKGIIDCNQATSDFLGYSRNELKGKDPVDFSPKTQPNGSQSIEIRKALTHKIGKRNHLRFEWYIEKKDKSLSPIEFAVSKVIHNGKEAFIAIWNDLSDRKQSEEKIEELLSSLQNQNQILEKKVQERTQALETLNTDLLRSNKDLEQFAYVASHDLQEPLRMVGNFVQLLDQEYTDLIDEEGKSYIQFAVDGVSRMSNLIRELLQFSRVGRKEISMKNTNIDLLVNKKILDLGERIKETKAEINIIDLPEKLFCEPNQLGIVFFNLISNALKFNQQEHPLVSIKAEENDLFWLFEVKDNGIGIPKQHQERIFKIFQRLHRKEDYAGTGIGLSLCEKIIRRHKGKIWVESAQGEGATFYFTIHKSLKNENHREYNRNLAN